MIIKNKNGEFQLNSCQYNWLTHHMVFDDIDEFIVSKIRFIVSTYEYEKASILLNELIETKSININSIRFLPCGLTPFDSKITK